MRKRTGALYALCLAVCLTLSACAGGSAGLKKQETEPETTVQETEVSALGKKAQTRLEDDYYEAVNREILNKIRIPSDESGWTWFYELGNQAYEKLNQILLDIVKRKDHLQEGSSEQRIAAVYLTAMDTQGRDQAGLGGLSPYLSRITSAATVEEYVEALASIRKETGFGSLISWESSPDLKDSSRNAAYVTEPDLVLGKAILESGDYQDVQNKYQVYIAQLLEGAGQSGEQAIAAAGEIYGFQKKLAEKALSPSEAGNPARIYHPFTREELKTLFTNMDVDRYLETSGMDQAVGYVVFNPELEGLVNEYLTEEHLPLLKNYSTFILLNDTAQYLTARMRDQKMQFQKLLSGKAQVYSDEKLAGKQTQNLLGFEFGRIYVEKCFSEADKKNMESMARTIIETYEDQINGLDWMSEATKKAARRKLESMTLKIGYPDHWPDRLDEVRLKMPEDGGVFIDNVLEIKKAECADEQKKLTEPVDKGEWLMTPQTVNAYYSPQGNEIVFPAAILQPPFYDNKGDYKQNLGGIGMVIAHEITHAFDNNGAQYDERGNYNNWWTEKDNENFKKRQNQVIDYYNGYGIDGKLTLGENIADLGAMSCVTAIAGEDDLEGLKRLFTRYAYIWASKYTREEEKNRLKTDPHAPGKVRVNAVLSALDAFYKAYGIKDTDSMYVAPEDRVTVWGGQQN